MALMQPNYDDNDSVSSAPLLHGKPSEVTALLPGKKQQHWTLRLLQGVLFCVMCMYLQFIYLPYTTVPLTSMAIFGWSKSVVLITCNFSLLQMLFAPVIGYLVYRFGIWKNLWISNFVVFLSFLVRCFYFGEPGYTVLTFLAIVVMNLAGVGAFGSFQKAVAEACFNPGWEQVVILTVGLTSTALGNAFGDGYFPSIVPQPEYRLNTENATVVTNMEAMHTRFFAAIYGATGMGLALTILTFILFYNVKDYRSARPLPLRELWRDFRLLLRRKDFWLLSNCYAWMGSLFFSQFGCVMSLLGISVLKLTQLEIGVISCIACICAAIVGSIVAVILKRNLQRYSHHRKLCVNLVLLIGLLGGIWFLLICYGKAPRTYTSTGASVSMMLVGHGAAAGAVLDRVCELCSDTVPTEAIACASSSIFYLYCSALLYIQAIPGLTDMFTVWILALGTLLSAAFITVSDF